MPLACSTAHHEGAHRHEPRPNAPYSLRYGPQFRAHAGTKVLIDYEKRFNGANGPARPFNAKIAIFEFRADRVLQNFVITAVLSEVRKRLTPFRQGGQVSPA